jgi:hypothetical protein
VVCVAVGRLMLGSSAGGQQSEQHLEIENRVDDDGDDDAIADKRPMIIYLGMDLAGLGEFAKGIDKESGHKLKIFQNHFKALDENNDGFCKYIERDELPAMNVSTNGISVRWRSRKYRDEDKTDSDSKSTDSTARKFTDTVDCGLHAVMQYSMSTGSRPLAALTRLNYQAFLSSPLCDRNNYCGWAAFEALDQLTNAYPNAYYVHGTSNYTVARVPLDVIKTYVYGFATRKYIESMMGLSRHGTNLKQEFYNLQNLFDHHLNSFFDRR